MAIFSHHVKKISRGKGRSSTASAAYRSGTQIVDLRTGEVHDYSRRKGVERIGVILPDGSPSEFQDRNVLWNEAERVEVRKNAVVAREVMVAIPHELNEVQRKDLIESYSRGLSDRYKTGIDYAIHEPDENGDERNYHAHIMMTTREIDESGFGKKTRQLDVYSTGIEEVKYMRESWATEANKALNDAGIEESIDHRSLAEQGETRQPTTHRGVGDALDKKQLFSERTELNNQIRDLNKERSEIYSELKELHSERRDVSDQIDSLYGERKEAYYELKKSQRLEIAVNDTRERANRIHEHKTEKWQKYQGWHEKKIHAAISEYHSYSSSEPSKKWYERESSYEKRLEEYELEKDHLFNDMHQTINKHRPPSYESSLSIAAGKEAYEHKIKKVEILSNIDSASYRSGQAEERYSEIESAISKAQEQRVSVKEKISEKGERLENIQSEKSEISESLEKNETKIRGVSTVSNEDEVQEIEIASDDVQAAIDERSKEYAQSLSNQSNPPLESIEQHNEHIQHFEQIEASENMGQAQGENNQIPESEQIDYPDLNESSDITEGRELAIEMHPERERQLQEQIEQGEKMAMESQRILDEKEAPEQEIESQNPAWLEESLSKRDEILEQKEEELERDDELEV